MRNRDPNRLHRLLPAHIRVEDHAQGRPLQALMALLTGELEVVEADIDALYENWFIETCEDWVVPYIGDLIGVRPLRPFGEGRGRLRAHVANTLALRQAKGTLAALEQVARDVTGWPVHGVEFFRRLIQSQNLNHLRLDNAGCVSLHDAEAASRVGGPFETAAHNVGVRSVVSERGRYNLPSIGLFVWRLQSYHMGPTFEPGPGYLGGVQPRHAAIGKGFLHFDPVGREMPLFNRPTTEESLAVLSTERNVPAPLRRRPLYHELSALRENRPPATDYFSNLPVVSFRLDDQPLAPEKLRCCDLSDRDDGQGGVTWRRPEQPGDAMFDPRLGRISLHPTDEDKSLEVTYAYAFPHDIGGGPYDRRTSLDSWIGMFDVANAGLIQIGVTRRLEELTPPNSATPIVSSLAEAISLWNAQAAAGSRGIIVILDNATYDEALTTPARLIKIPNGARLAIVAAAVPAEDKPGGLFPQGRRPFIASSIRVKGLAQPDEPRGILVVDGLLVEGEVTVIEGNLGELHLRHCSLGVSPTQLNRGVHVTTGNVGLSLCLDHVISGPLDAASVAGEVSVVCSVLGEDRDSDSDPATVPAVLTAPRADLRIESSTVFGRLSGRMLRASDSIFTGQLQVARRQEGCVRFCFVPDGSRTPRRYECAPDLTLARQAEAVKRAENRGLTDVERADIRARIQPRFTSRAFDAPAFARLAQVCPVEIREGGEGGAAMGAYHEIGEPFRRANLRDAIEEFLPLGLEAGAIFVT